MRTLGAGEEIGPIAGGAAEVAAIVLSGALAGEARPSFPGDILVGPPEAIARCRAREKGAIVMLETRATAALVASGPPSLRRIGVEDPVGTPFHGVTGIRSLSRSPGGCVIRLGPPPGARWVLVGLRALAMLSGKLALIDGDETRDIRPGELAFVQDPTATLYVQAGNDSALAVGFASAHVVVALG